MARPTMAALILRMRDLINDTLPAGSGQIWTDDQIQGVMDESRVDVFNHPLKPQWTFSGTTPQVLDYESEIGGGWEDGYVLKQYLTATVTPTTLEPIAGHWGFAASTLPPVFITGHLFDVYRGAADLLERWAAKYMTRFDFSSDGQHFRISQAPEQMQKLAATYRQKQRPGTISISRSDLAPAGVGAAPSLGPTEIDYMAQG